MSRSKKPKNISKSRIKHFDDEPTKIHIDKSNISTKNIQNTKPLTSEVNSTSDEKVFSPFYNKSSKKMFRKLWLAPTVDSSNSNIRFLNGFSKNSDVSSFRSMNENIPPDNKNFLKTFYPLLQSLPLSTTDRENTNVTRKIRIFPSNEQILFFNKCFGTTRFIYNRFLDSVNLFYEFSKADLKKDAQENGCIRMIKKKTQKNGSKTKKKKAEYYRCCDNLETRYYCKKHQKCKIPFKVPLNFVYWRNILIKKKSEVKESEKWLNEIPFDTKQLVIKNFLGGIKSAISNLKAGHIKKFKMKYKSRKNQKQFFFVDHRAISNNCVLWPRIFNHQLKMRKGERRWFDNYKATHQNKIKGEETENKLMDMIITRDAPGMYYLHIPYVPEEIDKKAKHKVISIDPGVRTFGTFYDPSGRTGKLGDGLGKRIMKIYKKVDKLISRKAKMYSQYNDNSHKNNRLQRQNLRKQCIWLRTKAKNIVKDHHWKMASFYCKNYEYIVTSKLDTKSIKRKIRRDYGLKRGSPMIRNMMVLAHGRFINVLEFMAEKYGRKLAIVDEAFTSQTCGECGLLHKKLESNKIFNCPNCEEEFDRDINGARNILIKNIQ